MHQVSRALRWAGAKVRRLRSLVKDEDHDTWIDDHHSGDKQKPPNVGPQIYGGGGGG